MLSYFKYKRGASLAVLLLVFITLALVGISLFSFYSNIQNVSSEVIDSRFLEVLVSKEKIMDYYINEILNKTILGSKNPDDLAENFRNELGKYKNNGVYFLEELKSLEKINASSFKTEENKVFLNVIFNIEAKSPSGKVLATSNYNRRFERNLG